MACVRPGLQQSLNHVPNAKTNVHLVEVSQATPVVPTQFDLENYYDKQTIFY